MLNVIEEMRGLGIFKPVMDGYIMTAGMGFHFWCFA